MVLQRMEALYIREKIKRKEIKRKRKKSREIKT